MVRPVSGRTMSVAVPVVARKEPPERVDEVGVRSCAHLHQGEAGRGMRHEDVDEPVTETGTELRQLGGEVDGALPGGVDVDLE